MNRSSTPWVVFSQHRPVYSSDASEPGLPGGDFSAAWEPLLHAHGVDLVIVGHQHMYERTHAVLNGTVAAAPDANGTYTNPAVITLQVRRGDAMAFVTVNGLTEKG